ncbi:MAG TPA: FAD binding domain-containing protein [Syntrophorhabdales bacterium]|nr:FAD binding domain-containing protein [Syntrophorhabdales bacterium]
MVQRYIFPETTEACVKELGRYSGEARILAGGTDLILAIQRGECNPIALLDITRISELEGIVEEGEEIRIGARVTHAACASSPLIQKSGTCLAEACATIGSPQIRHIATLVGNVVNAQPAADGAIALIALRARARIISAQEGLADLVENLYAGIGHSRVDSSREVLAYLSFPSAKDGEGSAFLRIAPRNAMGLPVLNGAAWVSLREQSIADIRIVLGPVSDRPFRAQRTEAVVKGARCDTAELLEEAASVASEEANPRDSLLRGSAEYRRDLIRTLIKRLLKTAIARAQGDSIHLAGSISL